MRAFIAIEIPDFNELSEIRSQLKNQKTVPPEQYHVNLAFFANLDPKKIPEIKSAIKEAASQLPPFSLSLEGISQFPKKGKPKVVFVPIISKELLQLHSSLSESLKKRGFPEERREYTPHLTLCRVKSIDSLPPPLPKLTVNINSLKLKRSILSPKGPTHITVCEVKL